VEKWGRFKAIMMDKKLLKQRLSLECVLRYYGHHVVYPEGFLLCPFHYETKASFHYDLIKNAFYCHGLGCNKKGDIFDFIQLKEGCNFKESIVIANKILEKYEGGEIPAQKQTRNQKRNVSKKAQKKSKKQGKIVEISPKTVSIDRFSLILAEILEVFSLPKIIERTYLRGIASFKIEGYVYNQKQKRERRLEIYFPPNFSEETVSRLRIGYCGLKYKDQREKLHKKGVTDEELELTGFFMRDKKGTLRLAEHMKGRILYPFIKNGKIVQMIGRQVAGFRTSNKYTYTKSFPGTSRVFYWDIVDRSSSILITEGVTDCIKANEVGVASISPVATHFPHTSFSDLAKKLQNKTIGICFDNDANGAGQKGAAQTQEKLSEHGVDSIIITLPRERSKDKMDVCEFINTYGSIVFKEVLKKQGFNVFHRNR
jgi:DNA primase